MKKSDFEYVLSLLRQYAGWDLSNDKYFIIDKKLYNFICEKGYASVEDLIAELKIGQKAMLWQVVEALTLSDTYFYRDYPVFKAFENYLLPQLREINRSSKKLRYGASAVRPDRRHIRLPWRLSTSFWALRTGM